jgi:hypothetical protein
MKVLLDGQEIATERPTLAAAVDAARVAAGGRGRVIVEVAVDGRAVDDSELEDPRLRPDAEVRLTSADPSMLVHVTLLEVADAIEAAAADQLEAARLIQIGRLDEAMSRLSAVLGAWEGVNRAVSHGAALLGLDAAELCVGDPPAPISGAVAELSAQLAQIKRCLEHRDWVGLSDVLAYDMEDSPRRWRDLLTALAYDVRARPAGAS